MAKGSGPGAIDPLPCWVLGGAGLLLFSYPWLAPFMEARFVGGVPLFFVYILGVWGGLIAGVALLRPGA